MEISYLESFVSRGSTVLQNAVVSVCNFCKFEFGKEQDPEEFFALSSLTDLLSINGLSCISQLQVDIQCTSCYNVAHESATEQSDISVPVSQTVERGNDLQEYINAHFSKEESKVCKKCNRQTKHVSRTQFHKLPNLLVIRLDRGTYKPGIFISKTQIVIHLKNSLFYFYVQLSSGRHVIKRGSTKFQFRGKISDKK